MQKKGIFINKPVWWTEWILSKFADDTELGGLAAAPGGCASIQRNLDRLEKQVKRNLMKFDRGKYKVLPHLERNNCRHQCRLQIDWLGSRQRRTSGVLVDTKLNINQHCVLMAKKADKIMYVHWAEHCWQVERGDLSQLSIGETHLEC